MCVCVGARVCIVLRVGVRIFVRVCRCVSVFVGAKEKGRVGSFLYFYLFLDFNSHLMSFQMLTHFSV